MTSHLYGARVFVTGADGFIGSHLVEGCVRAEAKVRALSCYSSFDHDGWLDDLSPEVRAEVEIVRGDIRDRDRMRESCESCRVVFHLAALIGIPYSYVSPSSYVDVNVQGTLNVVVAARDAGVERIVHTSTSEVYGTARTCPITEDHPLQGQSPYAASKIAADKMAEACFLSFGAPVVTLRPFNTFGPRQSQRAVIPTVIRLRPRARGHPEQLLAACDRARWRARRCARRRSSPRERAGYGLRPLWKPMHRLPMYEGVPRDELPVTDDLWRRVINLPSSVRLGAAGGSA